MSCLILVLFKHNKLLLKYDSATSKAMLLRPSQEIDQSIHIRISFFFHFSRGYSILLLLIP